MKKTINLIIYITATVYSLIYASLGGFKGNEGALSKIGLEHPVLFSVWGALTCLALFSGIIIGFKSTKHKFHYPLIAIAFIGMILTLCCDFDYDLKMQYWLHCIGSMTFSIVSGATVFLLFLLKKDYILTAITGVILIIDLFLLLIYKETALIELMPIFAGYILLSIHNMRREKNLIEIK